MCASDTELFVADDQQKAIFCIQLDLDGITVHGTIQYQVAYAHDTDTSFVVE